MSSMTSIHFQSKDADSPIIMLCYVNWGGVGNIGNTVIILLTQSILSGTSLKIFLDTLTAGWLRGWVGG